MKNKIIYKYSPGEELVITAGEYSGYHIHGVYIVLKPFDLEHEIQAYAESIGLKCTGMFVEDEEWENNIHEGLKKRLLEQGFIQVKNHKEINLGEYSNRICI